MSIRKCPKEVYDYLSTIQELAEMQKKTKQLRNKANQLEPMVKRCLYVMPEQTLPINISNENDQLIYGKTGKLRIITRKRTQFMTPTVMKASINIYLSKILPEASISEIENHASECTSSVWASREIITKQTLARHTTKPRKRRRTDIENDDGLLINEISTMALTDPFLVQ